jgi:(4-(4-[2-(gamma-L-glutamylamino)ethyl]phenoxymethyl)furan-2-yl)methanamine synthase
LVNVLGLDIGGANTKAAFISIDDGVVREFRTTMEYFPFWKRNSEQLCVMISKVKDKLASPKELDCVGVTLTAELCDVYRTKREGVNQVLECVQRVFAEEPVYVLDVDGALISVEAAKAEPLKVASANWAATGWMVSKKIGDCVVVDVGSTSTSIIPIAKGKIAAAGKTDLQKLMNGELVYTGSLRTNVAATVIVIPLKAGLARVSSELFAQSADVHLILGNITKKEYTVETVDGQGKTRKDSLMRLARVVCADTEMLAENEIAQIASYVYSKQVEQITDGLNQVYSRLKSNAKTIVPIVVTGLGKDFLARKAAEKAGIKKILDLSELLPARAALASPAVGVALMAATQLEGRTLKWMQ